MKKIECGCQFAPGSKVKGQKNITPLIYLGSIKNRLLNGFRVIEYTDSIFGAKIKKTVRHTNINNIL